MKREVVELPSFEGRLERVERSTVVGWAWDSRRPDMAVFVDIFVDGSCVCTVAANEPRTDLQMARKSDGSCAFSASLPYSVCDGASHVVSAVVAGTDGKARIGTLTAVLEQFGSSSVTTSRGTNGREKKNVFYPSPYLLGTKSNEQRVRAMIGKDDWLFLSHDSNRLHDQLQGRIRLGVDQLDVYRRVFAERYEAFDKLNIQYVLATAPTKEWEPPAPDLDCPTLKPWRQTEVSVTPTISGSFQGKIIWRALPPGNADRPRPCQQVGLAAGCSMVSELLLVPTGRAHAEQPRLVACNS